MKKYVKPELFYESFELSEQIAACDYDSGGTFSDPDTCTFTGSSMGVPSGTYFTEKNQACIAKSESYCYHASTIGFNLFNS